MSDQADPGQPGKTTLNPSEEILARMRAFDLLATPFGDETMLDYFDRIADREGLPDYLAYMLDIENFDGYLFLGMRDGAPTFTYEGCDALSHEAAISLAPMDAETGSADMGKRVLCDGAHDAVAKLMSQVAPPRPRMRGLRVIDGGKRTD